MTDKLQQRFDSWMDGCLSFREFVYYSLTEGATAEQVCALSAPYVQPHELQMLNDLVSGNTQ